MTDYIISEEELRQIYWKKKEPFPRILIDFIKSKQPITKVAEGTIDVQYRCTEIKVGKCAMISFYDDESIMRELQDTEIEIYIKESK